MGNESSVRDMLFISHANPEDNEFARWITLQLAREGYPVWCDLTKLLGGEAFWDDIQDAIKNRTITNSAKTTFTIKDNPPTVGRPARTVCKSHRHLWRSG